MKDAEALGIEIDRLDSAAAMLSMKGLPPQMHVDALRAMLPEIVKALRAIYIAETDDNPWDLHP